MIVCHVCVDGGRGSPVFSSKDNLIKHMKIHHSQDDLIEYILSFYNEDDLK